MLAEFLGQLNRVYVRERASESASYPTASSSEVPRHLRIFSCGLRDGDFEALTLEGTHLWYC
jgi:hypothetical protein